MGTTILGKGFAPAQPFPKIRHSYFIDQGPKYSKIFYLVRFMYVHSTMIIYYVLQVFCIFASTNFDYWIFLGLRLLARLDTF